MLGLEPKREPLPGVEVALVSARTFAVPFKILRHSSIPAAAESAGSSSKLRRFELRAERAGLHRLFGIVRPESG